MMTAMATTDWDERKIVQAVESDYSSAMDSPNSNAEEGVWVFVPTDTPADSFSYESSKFSTGSILSFAGRRARLAKNWFRSRLKAAMPIYDSKRFGSAHKAAESVCQVVIERPALALVAVGAGAGLAYIAANVLLSSGFVYICFIPNFNFYSKDHTTRSNETCCSCQLHSDDFVEASVADESDRNDTETTELQTGLNLSGRSNNHFIQGNVSSNAEASRFNKNNNNNNMQEPNAPFADTEYF